MKQPTSSQPRKQRKWKAKAPLHRRRKMICSPLSKELKSKYNRARLTPRKGDTVEVVRGEYKGIAGEVSSVDLKTLKVYVAGVTSKKADGTDVERPLDPSKIVITELVMEDKKRREVLERSMK